MEVAAQTLEEFNRTVGDITTAAGTAQGNDGLSRDTAVTGLGPSFEDPLLEDVLDR